MKKLLIKTILLSLFFSGLMTAYSQSDSVDTLNIQEVVVTASKSMQSAGNTTQMVDVISSKQAELMVEGNNNLSELLMYTPGTAISTLSRNDANWGTYAGIGPKYATWMLQGLPVDAFIDPMSLDMSIIDRIEVQRGPASVLYPNYLSQDFAGNQSPLAGTVNLIIKERIERQETRVSSSYGTFNTLNNQIYHQNSRSNLHYFAGINYEISDYTDYGTEGSWLNMKKDPEYSKLKSYAGLTWYYGDQSKNKVTVFVQNTNQTGDAGRVYRGFHHNYTTVYLNQSAQITDHLVFSSGFGIRVYGRSWQSSHFNVIDSLDANEGVKQVIVPVDAHLVYTKGIQTLTVGVDYQNATYSTYADPLLGYFLKGNESSAYQYGVYAQDELKLGQFIVRGGLRYNFIKNKIALLSGGQPGEPQTDYNRLLWSAGIKYHFSEKLNVFANAGNSFLTPGLKSMGGTLTLADKGVPGKNGQLPNPDLKPESGLAIDLGAKLIFGHFSASVRGFRMMIDDAIVENRVSENPSQSQSVNAGNTESTGVELELNHKLNTQWQWFANATYLNTKVNNDLDQDQQGMEVPFAPDFVANAGITWTTTFGLTLFPAVNYTGTYYDSSSKSGRKSFTPGLLVNFFAQQEIVTTKSIQLDLFGQFYNLTDNRYEMPWQFQNTGFSMMVGFKISFL
ncbi:MAG: TonB-dependent receptor [Bacteroidales bacterium]|nr:TonB-dependent receptor [Bacteroidales bacterium]